MSTLTAKKPKKTCDDINCPFHGTLSLRGRTMEGIVVSDKMDKTIVVRRDYLQYVPKYRRYERRRSNISAHNPPCLEIKTGDKVKLAECRPISKTVSFVAIEKLEEGSSGGKS
ncbi:MAG TPA: 30S ribosomal protein S17 [Candidatus Bathyarchaeota archaeon]|mgnify:CR=1 FL=1|nr:30S ribosomal protein S17 [Candidatus Bathyarchaeota archaeon]